MIGAIEPGSPEPPGSNVVRRKAVLEILHLLRLARNLPHNEQLLLQAVYEKGLSASEVARIMNCPPKAMQSRVRQIVKRLRAPVFQFVAAHGDDWPARRRDVAKAIIFRNLTHRQTSAALGLTLHQVRMEIARVKAMCEQHVRQEAEAAREAEPVRNGEAPECGVNAIRPSE